MIPVNSIAIPAEYVAVCGSWYNGSGDLLYAVCSTGGLTLGNRRPRGCDTDEKWYLDLWRGLSVDVGYARKAASEGHNGERDNDDYWTFVSFEHWINETVIPMLEDSYGLEDWED